MLPLRSRRRGWLAAPIVLLLAWAPGPATAATPVRPSAPISESVADASPAVRLVLRAMPERRFWRIIDETRRRARGDLDRQQRLLKRRTSALRGRAAIGFARRWAWLTAELYRHDVWAVAYIAQGGCSDDCFMDFRGWVISRGRSQVAMALRDVDGFGSRLPRNTEELGASFEGFTYASWGRLDVGTPDADPRISVAEPAEPRGHVWDDDELERLFPRTSRRFAG